MNPPLFIGILMASLSVQTTQAVDFELEVRPILEQSCFRCHGPHAKRIRGRFMMAGRESLLSGGDSGPAIVPGDPDSSLLIRMVRYEDEDLEMPPRGPLDPEQVELLARWIEEGAVWPGGDVGVSDTRDISLEEGRNWWAFRPVERPGVPDLTRPGDRDAARNEIDHFVFEQLAEIDLEAAPEADQRTLVRRLYIDLTGIPPSFDEAQSYLNDSSEGKWTRLVDQLLARSQYGERWARHWLDVVRFAQTNGYERDEEKLFIWRYRDYVIDAFNSDFPYDQFLREQLAGDELEEVSEQSLIATGFYSLGVWDTEPNDAEQAIWDSQDDILRTVTEGFMGVTLGCARCHDHRADPFRQEDYYSLISFLRNVETYDKPEFSFDSRTHRLFDDSKEVRAEWENRRFCEEKRVAKEADALFDRRLEEYLEAKVGPRAIEANLTRDSANGKGTLLNAAAKIGSTESRVRKWLSIEDRLELYLLGERRKSLSTSYEGGLPWAMCVSESSTESRPTNVLRRGLVSSPLEAVRSAFIPVLCVDDESAIPRIRPHLVEEHPERSSSGQRLALADWITDPAHPTTARVMVNRLWQAHFGEGLVRSPNDFGSTGELPSHPLLLDWLADEFVRSGWSVKHMHRLILNSAAYRRASNFRSPRALELDPGNRLLWRQQMRRLDAESLHDSILSATGVLNLEPGGRGFFPALSLEVLAGGSRPGAGWEPEETLQLNRRAIYAYVKRGLPVPLFNAFDAPEPSNSQGRRSATTVASQALTLLNGDFATRSALAMARGLIAEHGRDGTVLVGEVYKRIMLREPNPNELEIGKRFMQQQLAGFAERRPRSTFRAAIPRRSEIQFLRELTPEQCLFGPRESWDYFMGVWGNDYNMTREALENQGPYALLRESGFANGRVEFELTLSEGCQNVGFYLRARTDNQHFVGLQVIFDVIAQELRVLQWRENKVEPVVLRRASFELLEDQVYAVSLQLFEKSLGLLIDGQPIAGVSEAPGLRPIPLGNGRFGVQTMGPAVHLENLAVRTGRETTMVQPDDLGAPLENALALFCLTVLNLNEFLYVD